jgi:hypothetical protein
MRATLAIAELRLRECIAGRLLWLLPVVFAAALTCPLWIEAPTAIERSAQADQAMLTLVGALALLVAVLPAALGFPRDVRTGCAHGLLAAPVTRFSAHLGAVLGYGWFATLLLLGMGGAAIAGLEVAGMGAELRDPVRSFESVNGDTVTLEAARTDARIPFVVPDVSGDTLRVRITPQAVHQGGADFSLTDAISLGVGAPGEAGADKRAEFGLNVAFTEDLPLRDLRPGDAAELLVSGGAGPWSLVLAPGTIEVAGGPRLFTLEVMLGAACLMPLLFLLCGAALCGAARFGAPTAVGLALAVVLLFASQDILADSARFVLESAAAHEGPDRSAGDHTGHSHGPANVSRAQVGIAHTTEALLRVVPPLAVFDRSEALVERRAVRGAEVVRAWTLGAGGVVCLLGIGWFLLLGRELVPR